MGDTNFFHNLGDLFAGNGWGRRNQQKRFFNQSSYSHKLQRGEVYINTQVPYDIVNSIPEISIPMRRLASMFANGVFMLETDDGKKRIPLPKDLQMLFNKPNPLQSQNEWMKQYLMQLMAYGNQYIFKNKPSPLGEVPITLVNLNPSITKPVLTGKMYLQVSIDGIIEKFIYCESNKEETLEVNSVIWSRCGDLNDSVVGKSLISSLKFPISNTELAYKYLNVISGKTGMLGIISNKAKDQVGNVPMDSTDKDILEGGLTNRYGIEDNQQTMLVTNADVTYTPTTFETKKLLLLEQIDANFKTILNALGCNQNIFINSTYENLKHGLVSTHNDTIIPYADGFTQSLTEANIGVPKGYKLVLDYSHLSYLQVDSKQKADTFKTVSDGLNTLVTSQIITPQEANVRLLNQFGK